MGNTSISYPVIAIKTCDFLCALAILDVITLYTKWLSLNIVKGFNIQLTSLYFIDN